MDALGGGGPFSVRLLQVVGSLGLLTAAAVQFQLQARLDVVVAGHGLLGVLKAALGAAAFLVGGGGARLSSSSAWRCASARRLAAASPADCADAALTLAAVAVSCRRAMAASMTSPALAAGSGLFLKGTQGLAQLGHAGVQPAMPLFSVSMAARWSAASRSMLSRPCRRAPIQT